MKWAVLLKPISFHDFFPCQSELLKMRQQALETKHFIEKQEEEERKLLKIISEADAERMRQKKELDQVGSRNTHSMSLVTHLKWVGKNLREVMCCKTE